jgi:hypothetical protein
MFLNLPIHDYRMNKGMSLESICYNLLGEIGLNRALLRPYFIGIGLGLLTLLPASLLPERYVRDLLALILTGIGAVYVGFAISDGRQKWIVIELAVAIGFLALAALGLWVSPVYLGTGYFLHGVWDILHHSPQPLQTRVPRWYPSFCAVYDWVVAIFIFVRLQA